MDHDDANSTKGVVLTIVIVIAMVFGVVTLLGWIGWKLVRPVSVRQEEAKEVGQATELEGERTTLSSKANSKKLRPLEDQLPWTVASAQLPNPPNCLPKPIRVRYDGLLPTVARVARSGTWMVIASESKGAIEQSTEFAKAFDEFDRAAMGVGRTVDQADHSARIDWFDIRPTSSATPVRFVFDGVRELLAISPSGTRVLLRSPTNGSLEIAELVAGQPVLRELPGDSKDNERPRGEVPFTWAEYVDEDCILLYSARSRELVKITVTTGQRQTLLTDVAAPALSPNGRILALSVQGGVLFVDPLNNSKLGQIAVPGQTVAFAFDLSGTRAALISRVNDFDLLRTVSLKDGTTSAEMTLEGPHQQLAWRGPSELLLNRSLLVDVTREQVLAKYELAGFGFLMDGTPDARQWCVSRDSQSSLDLLVQSFELRLANSDTPARLKPRTAGEDLNAVALRPGGEIAIHLEVNDPPSHPTFSEQLRKSITDEFARYAIKVVDEAPITVRVVMKEPDRGDDLFYVLKKTGRSGHVVPSSSLPQREQHQVRSAHRAVRKVLKVEARVEAGESVLYSVERKFQNDGEKFELMGPKEILQEKLDRRMFDAVTKYLLGFPVRKTLLTRTAVNEVVLGKLSGITRELEIPGRSPPVSPTSPQRRPVMNRYRVTQRPTDAVPPNLPADQWNQVLVSGALADPDWSVPFASREVPRDLLPRPLPIPATGLIPQKFLISRGDIPFLAVLWKNDGSPAEKALLKTQRPVRETSSAARVEIFPLKGEDFTKSRGLDLPFPEGAELLAINPVGTQVMLRSGRDHSGIEVWEIAQRTPIAMFKTRGPSSNEPLPPSLLPKGAVLWGEFIGDASVLTWNVTGQTSRLSLWELKGRRELQGLENVGTPTISHNGELLAVTSGHAIQFYQAHTLKRLGRLWLSQVPVALALDPNGTRLAAVCGQNGHWSLRVVSLKTGALASNFPIARGATTVSWCGPSGLLLDRRWLVDLPREVVVAQYQTDQSGQILSESPDRRLWFQSPVWGQRASENPKTEDNTAAFQVNAFEMPDPVLNELLVERNPRRESLLAPGTKVALQLDTFDPPGHAGLTESLRERFVKALGQRQIVVDPAATLHLHAILRETQLDHDFEFRPLGISESVVVPARRVDWTLTLRRDRSTLFSHSAEFTNVTQSLDQRPNNMTVEQHVNRLLYIEVNDYLRQVTLPSDLPADDQGVAIGRLDQNGVETRPRILNKK